MIIAVAKIILLLAACCFVWMLVKWVASFRIAKEPIKKIEPISKGKTAVSRAMFNEFEKQQDLKTKIAASILLPAPFKRIDHRLEAKHGFYRNFIVYAWELGSGCIVKTQTYDWDGFDAKNLQMTSVFVPNVQIQERADGSLFLQ